MASADLGDLKPVYLIYGSEELLLERAVKRLRDRLAAVADLDFNLEAFDGSSTSADAILGAANTMPFMSDRRLVIVHGVDKLEASDLESLAAYARDPAPSTCLVLVATKIARNSKLYRAVAANGVAYEYAAPKRSEYAGEVVKMLQSRGKRISHSAAQSLVERVGRDLLRLDTEAGKLAAYVGDTGVISEEDVSQAVAAGAAASVFELTDAVGERDTRLALQLLVRLMDGGESPLGIHAMLTRHVRALVGARALGERGMGPEALAAELGMAPWLARNAAHQASHFEPAELARAIAGLADAEEQMKTSAADAGLVLERWIVAAAGAVGPCAGG
jgi:DNA polymerase-3 subunit delta